LNRKEDKMKKGSTLCYLPSRGISWGERMPEKKGRAPEQKNSKRGGSNKNKKGEAIRRFGKANHPSLAGNR